MTVARVVLAVLVVTWWPSAADASPQGDVSAAFSDFRSALKRRDGTRACQLMSLPTRANFRRQYDEFAGWQSCQELVDVQGSVIYRQWWRRVRLARARVGGDYACALVARPSNSGALFFRRSATTGWQLHDPAQREFRRFPKACQ